MCLKLGVTVSTRKTSNDNLTLCNKYIKNILYKTNFSYKRSRAFVKTFIVENSCVGHFFQLKTRHLCFYL